jgi:CRP-like cAMP-binding protein
MDAPARGQQYELSGVTQPNPRALGEFLASVPLFAGIGPDQLLRLLAGTRVRTYNKDYTLFLRGESADRLFIVLGGWIKIYLPTASGGQNVGRMLSSRDVYGEAAIFSGDSRHLWHGEVLQEARLLEIDAETLRALAAENPKLIRSIMENAFGELHMQMERNHVASMQAARRVAWWLLRMASRLDAQSHLSLPYEKQHVAAELGMSPETFSRAVSTLKCAKVRFEGNEVHIDDPSLLNEYYSKGRVGTAGTC